MVTSWVTDREGGFTDQQADMIERLVRVFSLAVKATATYRMARTLLATYVGDDVADKVLSGKIQRGSSDSIDAVLLIADLRGFTTLADSMPRRELLAALNDYHDCMTAPVEGRGGQVLKFLGDGLLATFDLAKGEREAVCEVALKAAVEAGQRVERLNAERARAGKPVMQLDQALHLGSVLYGNIGSELRLDFTVIGPAVNEVARMEGLCKKLGVNLLISEEVVSAAPACANDLVTFGRHRLRGVKRDQELFGLKREAALKKRVS